MPNPPPRDYNYFTAVYQISGLWYLYAILPLGPEVWKDFFGILKCFC